MSVDDHESVSIYPFSVEDRELLLQRAPELTFNWSTRDHWPVGVVLAFLWAKDRIWVTCGAHRHRVAAVRRNPKVSVVITGTGLPEGPFGAITIKGRAVIHDDRKTKDWFYPPFALKTSGGSPEAGEAFEKTLDSPLRVVIEVIPEKWITFDAAKFAMDAQGVLPESEKGTPLSSDAERMPAELKKRGLS